MTATAAEVRRPKAAGRLRRWTGKLLRGGGAFLWHLAGAWTMLGIFYTVPGPAAFRAALAAAAMTTFIVAWRRRRHPQPDPPPAATPGAFAPRLRRRPWLIAAVAIAVAYAAYHFIALRPQENLDWAADQAVMPHVEIDGPLVRVRNVRNFSWRSETEFAPAYYDATYDADQLISMDYAVAPFSKAGGLAHVFLCFGFADGRHVAVSVEARRVAGQAYEPVASLYRKYHLMYVVGDERDVLGLRGVAARGRVQLYPARTTPPRRRAVFLDMMRRAGELETEPEFYNLATSNCMNNLVWHLRRLDERRDDNDDPRVRGRTIPNALRLILTGFSDRVAYDLGYLDTALPFEQARDRFRVDDRIRRHLHDDDFSRRIRGADGR
jgi:hypothetical protein